MTITIHRDIEQGTPEWLTLRSGLLTASEVKLIISPKTLKPANNDKTRAHACELAAQRINGPRLDAAPFQSFDMIRGHEEEELARDLYIEHFANVEQVGFITNDDHGVMLGYSPDGLVCTDGAIECKSRVAKHQIQTAHDWLTAGEIPEEYALQVHAAMIVSGRQWVDLISYSNGMEMIVMRVERDDAVCEAIVSAALAFENQVQAVMGSYLALKNNLAHRTVSTLYKERDIIV